MEEYENMTVYELKAVQQELIGQFEEYKKVLADVYTEMGNLSELHEKITKIIESKNGQ